MEAEPERAVSIRLDKAIALARVLEDFVISLDRIGSREASGTADAQTLSDHITDWAIGPRLSHARGDVWDAIIEVIGEEALEAICEAVPTFPEPVPEEVRNFIEARRRSLEEHGVF